MVFQYIVKERYYKMLKYIRRRNPNMRQIARETHFAYMWVREILQEFQKLGLIEPVFNNPEYEKRDYNITFTEKGLKLLEYIEDIQKITGGENKHG